MDGSSTPIIVPHTPPSRPTLMGYHRRLDSFPTDDIDDGFGSAADDASVTSGMTPSFSMGAFPVFLIQESPSQTGLGTLVPQFPESPESTFGFQSPKSIASGYQQTWQACDPECGAKKLSEGIDYFSADQAFHTPKRAPINRMDDGGQARGGMERKLSLEKAGADFGRRLQCDDDETLVGHYEVTVADKNLRPTPLRYSSSTSTSLGSPLSDTFSPRSASYSMSTDSSLRSPRKASMTSCHEEADDFPTEVGGPVSLDLEEPPLFPQTSSTAVLELKPVPLRSQADISIGGPSDSANPFLANYQIHSYLTLEPAVGSFSSADSVQPAVQATPPASKRESYGHIGRAKSHSHLRSLPFTGVQVQRDRSDSCVVESDGRRSVSSPVASTQSRVDHRRAFSGTRESIQGLSVPTGSIAGRFRSSSVNSSTHRDTRMVSNDLIEQAARSRSRSNSASGTVPYAPSKGAPSPFAASKATLNSSHGQRTLNSSKSKDSLQSRFANLPGYVTFLREITIELWIDQEGFRAIRPRFELRRYTPGQQAPVGSGIRMKRKNIPSTGSSVGSPVPTGGDKLACSVAPSPSPVRQLGPLSQSESGASISSSTASVSPTTLLFPPQVQSTFEPLDRPIKSQFLENWGMAEFTMTKREGWNFHHGVADSEPVMRRLTVNGVEDRDYLSREASLSIKSNGVYFAKGTEDRGRFEWRLEYLVEDRRGSSGAVIHGEKTLTPLSFTCAPELLIPEQGRRVGLLHVMKKSVTPKIHSSKLDPPMVPTTPGRGHGGDATASTPSGSGSTGTKKLEALCKMARPSSAKSRPVTPKRAYPHAYSPPDTPVRQPQSTDEHGHRKAGSYSANRPDVQKLLGQPGKD